MLICVDRVQEVEEKIGAGLLEEVIEVAEGEMRLVDVMIKNQVYVGGVLREDGTGNANGAYRWEQLEEQSPPGQWSYFERAGDGAHTATQKPA